MLGDWLRDPTVWAVPFYALGIVTERRALARRPAESMRGYDARDARMSIAAGATALIAWLPINFVTYWVVGAWLWQARILDVGTGVLGWTVALIGWDFTFYWLHRAEHEVRFFWAGHVPHHSSTYYNLSTALRQPWTPLSGIALTPLVCLLGVRPEMLFTAGGLNLIYQFWIHTETIDRLPNWIEWIFNTPSHHRVHHGSNPEYLDKNHGGALIIWDRLFGTFVPERARVVFGTTKPVPGNDLVTVQLHEWMALARDVWNADGWRERVGYLARYPGWRPESSQRTYASAP